ncbi:ankyrin repeat domain-containing protein [Chryseobacterium sp. MEBOG06]|uniref:ankyrin repeat domain-containing protein n=1 Tax=Chryseobacterium sp. MEBOG06 TaxID=2879938 RepID=UPI001F187E59|nr:ankyrin repeat domain-containing protein [Chryseobacterium sp. MEBOG06]UKB82406.1 ankyrin repeat domain-containing protein [Chryseobacterium sp. MEBOG06]
MKNNEYIINIISSKNIDALKEWINNGGDAKTIIDDESLIQYIIDEIEDEDVDIYVKMIEILIENGADVNYFDEAYNAPVFQTIYLNKPKVLKLILEKGANIDLVGEERETPLTKASLNQNVGLMKLLLPYAHQDLINKPGSYHAKTPLGLAFYFGNLEMIELLLKYKADAYVNDGEGYLTIENIQEDIDEDLKKKIFDLIEQYKAK